MTLPRKGTRRITVNGARYRWAGSQDDGWAGGAVSLVVEAEEEGGQRLHASFDPWALWGVDEPYLSQRYVRAAIVEGLRRGWRPGERGRQLELRDAELYGEHPPPVWATEPGRPRELLDAVLAAPDDDDPRLVLADALLERGEPRGELIALQCRSAGPTEGEAAEREASLLQRHWRRWSAPARAVARRWRFARGFVDSVTCPLPPSRRAWEALHRLEPVREVEVSVGARPEALRWLPRISTRALIVHGAVGDEGALALIGAPHLHRLHRLALEGCAIGDAGALALAGAAALAGLRELSLRGNRIGKIGERALAASPHLRLHRLSLGG